MGNYILYNGNLYSVGDLYHHGIKGQKWGVRRYQNTDGTLTSAGRSRLNKTRYGKNDKNPDRDHSKSDKSPLALFMTNVALDIAMMNPIGLTRDTARFAEYGASYVKTKLFDKDRSGCKKDEKTGFLIKNKEMTQEQDAARVNPLVHNFDSNTKNNCMLCTAAYDLRRRGYEVRAKKASYGYLTEEVKAWYPRAIVKKLTCKTNKEMRESLKNDLIKQGNGARGNLMITWAAMRGGHSVAYEINNGNLKIVDAQINKIYNNPDSFLRKCSSVVEYARLDNINFNSRTIKEVAE